MDLYDSFCRAVCAHIPRATAREREERSAPLKILDDAGISYRLLSAGEVRA